MTSYKPVPVVPNIEDDVAFYRIGIFERSADLIKIVPANRLDSHGNRRKTHGRSDPTPLPTQCDDGCSMKSQSHFENFACSVAPRRLVSCPRTARNFTPPRHHRCNHPATSAIRPIARLALQLAPARRSCPHAIPIDLPRPPQSRAASF
jgi:hypothetical protein